MKKWILCVGTFIGALILSMAIGAILGLLLAGPHSDLLPKMLQVPAGLAIWAGVLGIPAWLACKVFLPYAQDEKQG